MKVTVMKIGNVALTADLTTQSLIPILRVWGYIAYIKTRSALLHVSIFLLELFVIYPIAGLMILLTGNTDIIYNIKRWKDED